MGILNTHTQKKMKTIVVGIKVVCYVETVALKIVLYS